MQHTKYCLQFLLLFIFCSHISAQVPVIDEPRHKTVLLNDYIRLIDVHLKPGDTTLYHIHAAPSVVVFISKSLMGTQDMSGTGLPSGEVLPGQTLFRDYEKYPVTHRVYNSGNNVFHVMDIELVKKEPSADSCDPIQQANVATTINEKLVRVYKLDLNTSQSLNINKSSCAHLFICISGEASVANKKIRTGEYIFFKPNTATVITNHQNENTTCVLLELK
jgi:hypothetical protein